MFVLNRKAEPLLENDETYMLAGFHPDVKHYLLELKSEYLSISTDYLNYHIHIPRDLDSRVNRLFNRSTQMSRLIFFP